MVVEVFYICDLCGLRELRDESKMYEVRFETNRMFEKVRDGDKIEVDQSCPRCMNALRQALVNRIAELREVK